MNPSTSQRTPQRSSTRAKISTVSAAICIGRPRIDPEWSISSVTDGARKRRFALLLERPRGAAAGDERRQPRRVEQPFVEIEPPLAHLPRHQHAHQPLGQPRDHRARRAQLGVERPAQLREFVAAWPAPTRVDHAIERRRVGAIARDRAARRHSRRLSASVDGRRSSRRRVRLRGDGRAGSRVPAAADVVRRRRASGHGRRRRPRSRRRAAAERAAAVAQRGRRGRRTGLVVDGRARARATTSSAGAAVRRGPAHGRPPARGGASRPLKLERQPAHAVVVGPGMGEQVRARCRRSQRTPSASSRACSSASNRSPRSRVRGPMRGVDARVVEAPPHRQRDRANARRPPSVAAVRAC